MNATADPQGFGADLFRAVFKDRIGRLFETSRERAGAAGLQLRLRLILATPELSRLPWEYLFDPERGMFLVHTARISIVRYLELPEPVRPLAVAPPLQVLVIRSRPKDSAPLAGDEEWAQIRTTLERRQRSRRMRIELLKASTFEALHDRLQDGPCHVLHFIGHGAFESGAESGTLLFEDEHGNGARVDAQRLSALLYDTQVRLVVLNACEGARHGPSDAFTGLAQDLIRKGIPAVVAMQFQITDRAAILFSRKFYRPLAEGATIDFAVSEARRALFFHGDDAEWGTPVLYTRSPDGHLFGLPRPSLAERLREKAARWSWLAAVLLIAGVVGYLIQPTRPPSGKPRPVPPSEWVPASPDCPAPPGTDIRFVRIPAGRFMMGSGKKDEKPAHEVEITRPFCLGQFEVTERQWEQVMEENPNPPAQPDGDLPKTKVSWNDAHLFIDKLNHQAGGIRFRLPYEAEWEYAVRATSTTDYSFGDDSFNLYLYANCLSKRGHGDGFDGAAPIGQFKSNPWHLYDMHGNVWEWVEDWYGDYSGDPAVDPHGPAQGEERVRRGGGFESSNDNCRSTARKAGDPAKRFRNVGFRIVEVLDK